MKILYKFPCITVPNFRMFGQHFTKKNQDYRCIVEGCDCISAISEKQSILKTPQHCQYCLGCVQISYNGRYELVLPVKICFVRIGAVLSDILTSQKCIKWGWCIIRGWMTVVAKLDSSCYQPTNTAPLPARRLLETPNF